MSVESFCIRCKKNSRLERIGDEVLCKPCLIFKYEKYRDECMPQCSRLESVIANYKKEIDSLHPQINGNLANANRVAESIEQVYAGQIKILNEEKKRLLALVDECKRDCNKFFEFIKQLDRITYDVNEFKNPTQNIYQDNVINSLVENFEKSFEKSSTLGQSFNSMIAQPINTIEKFVPSENSYQNLIGTLSLNKQTIKSNISVLSNLPSLYGPIQETSQKITNSNIDKWVKKAAENPFQSIEIKKIPAFLTSFRNYLFCLAESPSHGILNSDDKKTLLVFTVSASNEFELISNTKCPIKNIQNVAVNLNHFAISYINLDSKTSKKLNLKPSGVVLFPRNLATVDFNSPSQVNIGPNDYFVHPIGVALNNEHIFVCDQSLKTVFKINVQNRCVEAKYDEPEGNPYKISINNNYLVLTDIGLHRISVHSILNLNIINHLTIQQSNENGPYGVYLTNDNTIFFKNYKTSQLVIIDIYLNNQTVFQKIQKGIEDFTVLECVQQVLVVGIFEKNVSKLICYNN